MGLSSAKKATLHYHCFQNALESIAQLAADAVRIVIVDSEDLEMFPQSKWVSQMVRPTDLLTNLINHTGCIDAVRSTFIFLLPHGLRH